ncbi:MAG: sulfotransferase domain-containing protein [Flavobacteriales bacterium]
MNLYERLRLLSHRVRPRLRPTLLILGAQKAGTSALFDMLAAHPQVLPSVRKELDHFSTEAAYAKGMDHYLSHFPVKPLRSVHCITLEASPAYLFFSGITAPRIARDLPGAYCLAILRDPVQRAYSAWNMCRDFVRKPNPNGLPEHRSFAQAVEDELAGRTTDHRHKYLLRGQYADQIADFKQHLPAEKLLVRSYLQLKQDPASLVNELTDLLGLKAVTADHPLFAIRSNKRPYSEPLDPGLASELYRYFAPEMARLDAVLGHPLEILGDHA